MMLTLNAVSEHRFEQSSKGLRALSEKFHRILLCLRFEGKPVFGKNLKAARLILKQLTVDLNGHFEEEQTQVFPFLKRHIPRLIPAIEMLEADHSELKDLLKALKLKFQDLSRSGLGPQTMAEITQLKETGNYFLHLLSNHLQAEDGIVFGAIRRDLRPEEKRDLFKRLVQRRCHGKGRIKDHDGVAPP